MLIGHAQLCLCIHVYVINLTTRLDFTVQMDVLKELFGDQDEDFEVHIAKSLFGRQEPEQIDSDDCSDESPQAHAQPMPPGPQFSKVSAHEHERTELPPTQSTFPPLPIAPHNGTDIASVPEQMPMYLLEDDEGNDEEIIRLLGTSDPSESSSSPLPVHSQPSQSSGSSVSVLFPWMSSGVGLNVTPVQVLPNPVSAGKKKPRHGGGWPKGKSRKPSTGLPPIPKPPSSGYGLFLAENMAREKLKTTSMSQVSKRLGKLWSGLSPAQKKVYRDKSEIERERYLAELRRYLLATGSVCIEDLDKLFSRALATENNDKQLTCDVCKLSFSSLHNKRCHYSSRLHTQTLIDLLRPQPVQNGDAFVSSLCSQIIKFNGCVVHVEEEVTKFNSAVRMYASLQQTAAEQEFIYIESERTLMALREEWTILRHQLQILTSLLHSV